MPVINFYFPYRQFALKSRKDLKIFIRNIFKAEKKKMVSLQCIFCSDAYLLAINRQYLQHDYYTDIITFNLGTENNIEGEIYISIERVKENARLMHTSFKEEIHRVIFHGILHLCGHKDKLKSEKEDMRRKEDRLLQLYFNKNKYRST
ncbi:rRNA maturation RNase YbeY [Agriterribacter sp.]|uniref:rRNA maturation RNase YbeY n=1 Tax=Agriterribacter sp. TaxID=2821509 RepID=UPI002B7C005C|nr:rRNA maturation RNase YbeY [Agriterribacter sp.]HRO44487.1 rRNA maturation RNase YbeY [Agriterribacter sp.]HRQ16487.1 rRNA maturation RNase YbeY [Agriterribacter sp.]